MALLDAAGRLGATLVAILQTRLELAATELEEEALRLAGYMLLALLSLFLLSIAIMLLTFFVVLLFWDQHRLEAVLGMALLLTLLGAAVAFKVRSSLARKPRMLAATFAELNKDAEFVKRSAPFHEH